MREKVVRIRRDWARTEIKVSVEGREIFPGDDVDFELRQPSPNIKLDELRTRDQMLIVGVDEFKVYVDTPIIDFIDRVAELARARVSGEKMDDVLSLQMSFRKATLERIVNEIVTDAVKTAIERATEEMKKTTILVV